jgi:hypothetical protein
VARHATAGARLEAGPGRLRAELAATVPGRGGPMLDARLKAALAGAGTLDWSADVAAAHLDDVGPLVPGQARRRLAWDRLAASLKAHGHLDGVVMLRGGLPALAAHPLATARGEQELEFRVAGVRWKAPDLKVDLPSLTVAAHVRAADGGLAGDARVEHSRIDAVAGGRQIGIEGGPHVLEASLDGDPRTGRIGLKIAVKLAEVRGGPQEWPLRDAALAITGHVLNLSAFRLDELLLDNPAAGTRLRLTASVDEPEAGGGTAGSADRVPGRQALALDGQLDQDLARLGFDPAVFSGKGLLAVPFHLESGDRVRFRATAEVRARDVFADLPRQHVSITGLNGTIRVVEDVAMTAGGPVPLLEGDPNAWTRVRFQDLSPFLGGASYVAIQRLVVGPVDAGPVAGNLRVFRNVIGLDQLEAVWRDGRVTGQVGIEARPGDASVHFRGSVTGVRPSGSGERLDANAALDLALARLELAGRIQVTRVGRDDLRALLDALDPYGEDVASNRLRKALVLGYPKYLRVRLDGGFLSAKVELGGIAAAVRIDELRGVPTGPLLRRYLGPLLPPAARAGTPAPGG